MTNYSTDTGTARPGSPEDETPRRAPSARSRLLWFIAALAASALTARFGVWQLSRAHQKLANAAMIAERGAQPPLAASELALDPAGGERQWQRHITLQGHWDGAHTIYLMNRTMGERSGFFVMTPLRLPSGDAVVVQRGWVARDDGDPMKAPVVAAPTGEVRVAGHVAPWPAHWIDLGGGAPGPVRQNLEQAPFSAESHLSLRPVTVVEDVGPDNAGDGLRRDWAAPDVGVMTNYGYAVQWFAMSAGFLGLWAWLRFFRGRRDAPTSESHAADPPSP